MRAYFFGNMYLSSIQQGIQAAHCIVEILEKHKDYKDNTHAILQNWARIYKTMILLNAGYSSDLQNLINIFNNKDNIYPWSFFQEGEDALGGALTCVGIVLPEKIYVPGSLFRTQEPSKEKQKFLDTKSYDSTWQLYTDFEMELVQMLTTFPLAR